MICWGIKYRGQRAHYFYDVKQIRDTDNARWRPANEAEGGQPFQLTIMINGLGLVTAKGEDGH